MRNRETYFLWKRSQPTEGRKKVRKFHSSCCTQLKMEAQKVSLSLSVCVLLVGSFSFSLFGLWLLISIISGFKRETTRKSLRPMHQKNEEEVIQKFSFLGFRKLSRRYLRLKARNWPFGGQFSFLTLPRLCFLPEENCASFEDVTNHRNCRLFQSK